MPGPSLALSNMRAVTILLVLGFHSVLAYLDFLPAKPYPFDEAPYAWQAFAIIDSKRFLPFDIFCAWQDVCLMSIFFFLSGLFVWPSLSRKGSLIFLSERLLRIGVPCILVVMLLMPVAYYPAYAVGAADPSVEAYWKHLLALPFWPCGPQWFLWELILLNVIAGLLSVIDPRWGERLGKLASTAREHPLKFLAGLMAFSAIAYLPPTLIYSPWEWTHYGPVAWQICRPIHYAVFFFAGVAVGARGLDNGLLALDGPLARHTNAWIGAAIIGFTLWILPTSFVVDNPDAPFWLRTAAALGFVAGCASGCFAFIGVFLRHSRKRHRTLDSLSANAYGMYLTHYVFVVWLQFALLSAPLPGVAKALIVFALTLAISWPLAAALSGFAPWVRARRGTEELRA